MCPPPLDAPLLQVMCSLSRMKGKTPWKYSPCKLQATKNFSSSSQGFLSNLHEVCPLPPQDICPLYPLFGLLEPTLKDQWPRLDLAKSNQWVRSTPKISLRKPTFLSFFMSINSPTL